MQRSIIQSLFFVLCFVAVPLLSGFTFPNLGHAPNCPPASTTAIAAKKIRNKQADLLKKMAMAKEQKMKTDESPVTVSADDRLSDKAMKEQNDRRRFEEMLKKESVSLNSVSSDGYLSLEQEEAEIDAYQRGVDRLFEGDPAPTQPFEELINIKSEKALGEASKRVVPWLKNTNSDFLIIVCDPRVKSPELRETAQSLSVGLKKDLLSKLIIVNADTPAENRRWLKKSNIGEGLTVYSDEKREWMRAYTALGENRWSMTMFVLSDERIQKIAREMESIAAVKVIQNAVQAMAERRL